jgi:hypothetical protein
MTDRFDNYVEMFLEKHFMRNAIASAALLGSSMAANAQSPDIKSSLQNGPAYVAHVTPKIQKLVGDNGAELVAKSMKILLNNYIESSKSIISGQDSEILARYKQEYEKYGNESLKEKVQELENEKSKRIELTKYQLKDYTILLNSLNGVKNQEQFNNIIGNMTNIPNYIGIGYINPQELENIMLNQLTQKFSNPN